MESIKSFLDYIRLTRSENTAKTYSYAIADVFPEGYTGLDRGYILDYIKRKKATGVSGSTIKSRLACIVTFMKFIKNIDGDILDIFNNLPVVHRQQAIPTMAEYKKYIKEADSPRDRLIFIFAGVYGMRVSEIAALNIDDITSDRIFIRNTKTNADRYIFYSKKTLKHIDAYMGNRHNTDANALFTTKAGRCSTRQMQRITSTLSDELGYTYSVHALRRFCATTLKLQNNDNTVIDRIIGHSEGCTGNYYIGNIDNLIKKALGTMENFIL